MLYLQCPYCARFRDTRSGKYALFCELGTFTFPDSYSRSILLYGFCGNKDGFRYCPFYAILDNYYRRKDGSEPSKSPMPVLYGVGGTHSVVSLSNFAFDSGKVVFKAVVPSVPSGAGRNKGDTDVFGAFERYPHDDG